MSLGVLTFVDPDWSWGFADPGLEEPSIDTVSYTLSVGR